MASPLHIKGIRKAFGKGDKAVIEEAARTAEKTCPVSKVLNAQITMDVTVV